MGYIYRKIKYYNEIEYGQQSVNYLYMKVNNTTDIVHIYDTDGSLLMCFSENVVGKDMGWALVDLLKGGGEELTDKDIEFLNQK